MLPLLFWAKIQENRLPGQLHIVDEVIGKPKHQSSKASTSEQCQLPTASDVYVTNRPEMRHLRCVRSNSLSEKPKPCDSFTSGSLWMCRQIQHSTTHLQLLSECKSSAWLVKCWRSLMQVQRDTKKHLHRTASGVLQPWRHICWTVPSGSAGKG